MVTNNLKITLRGIQRKWKFASLNIIGLAIGLACCLLLLQFIERERAVDQYHPGLSELYRLNSHFHRADGTTHTNGVSAPAEAGGIKSNLPDVVDATRIMPLPYVERSLLRWQDRNFYETDGFYADSNFFNFFAYEFLGGDPATALQQPQSIVLSAEIAERLFGDGKPLGQVIDLKTMEHQERYQVTGVFDQSKVHSHLNPNFFLSSNSTYADTTFCQVPEWMGFNFFYTYLRTQPGTDIPQLTQQINDLLDRVAGEEYAVHGINKDHSLIPVSDIYLSKDYPLIVGPKGNGKLLWLLAAIAALILVVACVNFMNLGLAKTLVRVQEIGVRRAIGAEQGDIRQQFFVETGVYALISTALAGVLYAVSLPGFAQLTGKPMTGMGVPWALMLGIPVLLVITTALAGWFPAWYFARLAPKAALAGKVTSRLDLQRVQRGLVVFQFVLSILLLQSLVVIFQQLQYIQSKDLGFDKEAKLIIPMLTPEAQRDSDRIAFEFSQLPEVEKVGRTSEHPANMNRISYFLRSEQQSSEQQTETTTYLADPEYMQMMDFKLLAGRFFERARQSTDTMRTCILTEMTVKKLGFTLDNVIGQTVIQEWKDIRQDFEVIGVIADWHGSTLQREIYPIMFFWHPEWTNRYLAVAGAPADYNAYLQRLEQKWRELRPNEPFYYFQLTEQLQANYAAERRLGQIITLFALLAVLIAALGLLGLASFAAQGRTKEIGIRKVLGASVGGLVRLFSKEYLLLVGLAFVLATPISYWLMNNWLQDFSYRISIPWLGFGVIGLIAAVIAGLTVGWQFTRAALVKPVESLRDD